MASKGIKPDVSENDDSPEFCYFYGMNEAGKTSVYCYDMKEKTMQRYVSASVSKEPYEQLNVQYKQLAKDYNAQVQENERLRIQLFTAALTGFYIKVGSGEPTLPHRLRICQGCRCTGGKICHR